jgi:hypothetical protein
MKTPIFNLQDHFDTTIAIGEDELPIRVKRLSRAEMDDFEKKMARYVFRPRGTAPTDEDPEKREHEQLAFFEDAIRECITIDEGLIVDRGKPVTDGAGLLGVFHARKDVLSDFVAAIFVQNRLGSVIRKNSNSPRASAPGSTASTPTSGEPVTGAEPDSTVANADGSGSATGEGATASTEDPDASSGEAESVKVH